MTMTEMTSMGAVLVQGEDPATGQNQDRGQGQGHDLVLARKGSLSSVSGACLFGWMT